MFRHLLKNIGLGIVIVSTTISSPGLTQTQSNLSSPPKLNCAPKSNQSHILSAPNPKKIHPNWKNGIGYSWTLLGKKIIKNNTGIYIKGNLYSPRGGLVNKNVFIIQKEWDCS
ncbi:MULTISPECIES: hypothetical protein [unclassified Nostoc]|uniref:hypothetical protein n=1 Tax=unclassified Nostoc TaxID=2593658 RepID=UPI002AD4A2B0|nr:hypothetical protein [Nostoc sp. DedQUE03]MDZ7975512.1 hypothetical protein [Nostoc sp. DedQUE03]MDZ8045563.1 hypothetical protein [Nostoc sp. DedQUE02]